MNQCSTYVGLDVHKDTTRIVPCSFTGGRAVH